MKRGNVITVAAAGVVSMALAGAAQMTDTRIPTAQAGEPAWGGKALKKRCQVMMADATALKAEVDAMDERLAELLSMMNGALGDDRVDRIVEVINEMAVQHRFTRTSMMAMQERAMDHVLQHMLLGNMERVYESLSRCPMVERAKGPNAERQRQGDADGTRRHGHGGAGER